MVQYILVPLFLSGINKRRAGKMQYEEEGVGQTDTCSLVQDWSRDVLSIVGTVGYQIFHLVSTSPSTDTLNDCVV